MTLLITDSNIFFDLISIEALTEFFSLDAEICTTELVINEIRSTRQMEIIDLFIRSNKLKVYGFSPEDIESILAFQTKRTFKGITDKSVLWKALQQKGTLLTGDKKLQKEAEDQNVPVHGSIWIISTLVRQNRIDIKRAIVSLEDLKEANGRLPTDTINKLLTEYKKTTGHDH